MTSRMTDEEYVKYRGVRCPYCGVEGHIEGGFVEIDEGGAFQNVSCGNCGKSWTDFYRLVGYEGEDDE